MWQDPIVEEVRSAREKLAVKWAKDSVAWRAYQKRLLKQWPGRVVSKAQLDKERASKAR
ncbi:MAG: hypothetical protein ACYC26_01840 [Phycisphaerales bacterium]